MLFGFPPSSLAFGPSIRALVAESVTDPSAACSIGGPDAPAARISFLPAAPIPMRAARVKRIRVLNLIFMAGK
jgi:hypothetical protein